jgi:mRNA-degrading endonuclease RelE of RelBE toxin-antitoxin system
MAYDVSQTRRFLRQYKKLNYKTAKDVDEAVVQVAAKPTIGEKKKGDLSELWVFKFRSRNQLYLLGYSIDDGLRLIYLESIGSHENFYRDIKR